MDTDIAWLKQLRRASWRNVPFQVDTVDISAGQNTVLREYPFQDLPTVFSMGTAAEEIKFSAYVIGDDYLDQLAKLRDVLKGDGVLIHPTQGSIRCYFHGKYTIKEAPASQGGIARLDLTFIRAEERRYPVAKENSTDKMLDDAANAKKSLLDRFNENFDLSELTGWSLDDIKDGMRGALDTVWDVVSIPSAGMSYFNNLVRQFITNPTNEIFSIAGVVSNMVQSVMRIPESLSSNQALSMFKNIRSLWSKPPSPKTASSYQTSGVTISSSAGQKLDKALTLPDTPYQTPTRQKQVKAMESLKDLFEGMATISAVEAIAQVELDNYDQVTALRQDFNQQFTQLLRRGVADHDVLLKLHTSVLNDLRERSKDLARVMTYTPATYQPVIYISYRLFGTIKYADEIMAMNPHIRNPLLVPPGKALQIIKRDE